MILYCFIQIIGPITGKTNSNQKYYEGSNCFMYHDDRQSLKETGQKGDFLLPFVAVNTIMPDFALA